MQEYQYDFLKRNRTLFKIYRDFPLPVIIVNKDWKVYWCNDLARQYYSHVSTTEGLEKALAEFDRDDLIREARESGNCTIQEIFPFTGVSMSVTPVMEDAEMVGMVLMLVRLDNLIDAKGFYRSTRMSGALEGGIRSAMSEVFSALDSIYLKANVMDSLWMKDNLNAISGNGYRVLRVAANLNEYGRYQSGLLDLRLRETDLTAFLERTRREAQSVAGAAGIPLDYRLPAEAVYVRADRERLENAFFNLLHNALFYTRPGNQVTVSLRKNAKTQKAAVCVSDRGIGIPADILPDVTRPYFSYGHGTAGAGIGLGLSIAKLAAQAHDGSLSVKSGHGEGTAADLYLPLSDAPDSLRLEQGTEKISSDRFGSAYVGLMDIFLSHHRR